MSQKAAAVFPAELTSDYIIKMGNLELLYVFSQGNLWKIISEPLRFYHNHIKYHREMSSRNAKSFTLGFLCVLHHKDCTEYLEKLATFQIWLWESAM